MEDFKTILQLVKPYWKRVAAAGIISIIISAINASLAWLVKPALDNVLIQKDIGMIILLPIGVMLIFTFRGAATFVHEYLMRSASQKMLMSLRNRLYDHIIHMPINYFGKNSSGSLLSKVINDVKALESIVSLTLKDLLIETATIIALTCVALWRSWDLTLIAIIILPVAFYGAGRLGKRLKSISKRTQKKISMITELLQESFTGIKILKSFNMEAKEQERFMKNNKDFYHENMRAVRVTEFVSLIMETAAGIGIAFVIWYGSKLIVDNIITIGDFFSFLTAIFLLYTPAKRLAKASTSIQKARAPLERIYSVLSENTETEGTGTIEKFSDRLEYRNISFAYPSSSRKALDSISIIIKKGELVAVVGKSGGGKSTLVNMLPRFFIPDSGNIYIDGTDISTLTLSSLRAMLGIVSQEVILFNDTILENIRYGKASASKEEVIEAARTAYADDFISEFPEGYDTAIGEKGLRLSGGQRQRISIARAVLKNPPVLILDEATSSLDTAAEVMLQNALEQLMKNRTTIVIAHRLSTIRQADRILVMDKGRIVESGTHNELLDKEGIYQKLYKLQFRGQEADINQQ